MLIRRDFYCDMEFGEIYSQRAIGGQPYENNRITNRPIDSRLFRP